MKPLPSILAAICMTMFSGSVSGQNNAAGTNNTASEIIETIIRKTGSPAIPNTVDVIEEPTNMQGDAANQGRKKAVIFLGHIASEEAGMDYCADWLKGFIKNIPVWFVESGPSYRAY